MKASERTERRRLERALAELRNDPELVRIRRERRRKEKRRRWPGLHPDAVGGPALLHMFCGVAGWEKGGRPPAERRCTKRLGSRLCWNWRTADGDRCRLHPRR